MGFKLTIGTKIGAGFGIVILLTIVAFIFTNITLNDSKKRTDDVVQVVTPSVASLNELNLLLERSQRLISKWYFVPSPKDDVSKQELRDLIKYDYPKIKNQLDSLSVNWTKEEKESIKTITSLTDQLFVVFQEEIMEQLVDFSNYEDAQLYFLVKLPLDESEEKLIVINNQLHSLIESQKKHAETVTGQMFDSFTFLQTFVKLLGIALVIGGIFVALITIRTIVKPVKLLKEMLNSMSKGILPKQRFQKRSDEIGEMNEALTGLVGALEGTTDFAREVGSGNFTSEYKPLSDHDTLGHALIKMRYNLAENERILEQKVIERTEEVVRQKEEILGKNEELEVLYTQVTDSIRYAKRIQEAILPPESVVSSILPNSFILYKPKDIVSGDFYWLDKKENRSMVAAVDCTGHGVPGAFMSIVGYNLLKDIVTNSSLTAPGEIMDAMSDGVNKTLHNKTKNGAEGGQTKDGMDMTLVSIDYAKMELQFAGANNPLYIIRNGEIIQYKADKFPIGYSIFDEPKKYTTHTIPVQKKDTVYIFSDGYADQFGGPKGKKLMLGKFREILFEASKLPVEEQKQFLNETIESWKGNHEQVDDILVIGINL
ncbi:MAG: SpoIIE family protein phosphatase [Bacteroidota bacterium]|nr:SpoIIE family protein phosphatase [Bacteroidota bacterium]